MTIPVGAASVPAETCGASHLKLLVQTDDGLLSGRHSSSKSFPNSATLTWIASGRVLTSQLRRLNHAR
jgi:hypothetical protein